MKKTYVKPEIMFESFALATNIAAGCEKIIDTQSQNQCGIDMGGGKTIFISSSICTTVQSDGIYNGFCYHVPTEDKNIFNSL